MAKPFTTIREAALALLNSAQIGRRAGGFAGQIASDPDCTSLTPKQAVWFALLLADHGFPPLADGGDA